MKLSALFQGTGVTGPEMEIAGITCDSRRVEPGWAFVCMEGAAADEADKTSAEAHAVRTEEIFRI